MVLNWAGTKLYEHRNIGHELPIRDIPFFSVYRKIIAVLICFLFNL